LVERNAEEDKTVHWKSTALWGGKKVELRQTQRAVTPYGGLAGGASFDAILNCRGRDDHC
jgi:hypothetical protein